MNSKERWVSIQLNKSFRGIRDEVVEFAEVKADQPERYARLRRDLTHRDPGIAVLQGATQYRLAQVAAAVGRRLAPDHRLACLGGLPDLSLTKSLALFVGGPCFE